MAFLDIRQLGEQDFFRFAILREMRADEARLAHIATTDNVAHVAILLFAGYIDAATSMSESCGGGGSAPSSGWGKKDDEDDWKFAHRCAQMAHAMCKPKPRSRSFHR